MDYTHYISASHKELGQGKAILRLLSLLMTNGRFLCSCGHEQGSLPSLLALPGEASLLALPGDGMFQAQRVVSRKCRPVILHGYGGAKKEMPTSLAKLLKLGWIRMATAMVGSASFPPLSTGNDWRPILGTSVDTRILPPPLSAKESLLLLSQCVRLPRDDLHIMHATNSWLQPGKVNLALGPDCDDAPHSLRVSPLDLGVAPYLAVLFGPQKADQDHPNKTVKQEGSQAPDANQAQDKELPSPEEVLVTLSCRWTVVVQPICQHSPLSYSAALLPFAAIACSGYKLSRITLMMSPFWFPVASCYSWFVRLLPRWGMMYIWSIQADVTNEVTAWHCVLALLPSLVVECMFP